MRPCSVILLAALAVPLWSKTVQAQGPTASLALAPAEAIAAVRLRMPSQPLISSQQPDLELVSAKPSKHTGQTLMIVGGAVLLVGLIADEAIVSIAGVAIGGYGLYVYLEAKDKRR